MNSSGKSNDNNTKNKKDEFPYNNEIMPKGYNQDNKDEFHDDKTKENHNSDDSNYFLELVKKNSIYFAKAFGKNYQEKYMQFFEVNEFIFEVSLDLKTEFYTMSFEKVKNIIEGLKKMDYDYLISDKFYDLAVNFLRKNLKNSMIQMILM